MGSARQRWSPWAVISGGLLVLSGLMPWVSSGPGSSFRGVELASTLMNSQILPDGAKWAGVAVLFVALNGVAQLASLSSVGSYADWFRGISGGAVLLVVVSIAGSFGVSTWGIGLWCAALGSVVAVGSSVAALRDLGRRRGTSSATSLRRQR